VNVLSVYGNKKRRTGQLPCGDISHSKQTCLISTDNNSKPSTLPNKISYGYLFSLCYFPPNFRSPGDFASAKTPLLKQN